MKKTIAIAALLATGILLAPAGASLAANSGHDHGAGQVQLRLNDGKKWPTDEPLRHGMAEISTLMAKALPDIHHGRYESAQYGKLAGGLSEWVDYMTANCKLEPEVDAQLHVILEQIIDGAARMESGAKPMVGAAKVLGAMNLYGRHFDHPGWQQIEH